jgi:hypothetical protein
MKKLFLFLFILILAGSGGYSYFQYLQLSVGAPVVYLTAAPGDEVSVRVEDYIQGQVESSSLVFQSGPMVEIIEENNAYRVSIPRTARGMRIILELAASNAIAQQSVEIEITTAFIGPVHDIAIATDTTCLTDTYGVFCWGSDDSGRASKVPAYFTSQAIIKGGGMQFCGLENKRLICWGDITADLLLKDPRLFAVGYGGVCYVDAEKLFCLGYDLTKDMPDKTSNIRVLSVGSQACLLDDSGLQCWGSKRPVPDDLVYPVKVSVSYHNICALDAGEIKCWGRGDYEKHRPPLGKVKDIDVKYNRICAQDEHGWHCWSTSDRPMVAWKPRHYPSGTKIFFGRQTNCTIADGVPTCPGLEYEIPYAINAPTGLVTARVAPICFVDEGDLHCFGEQPEKFKRLMTLNKSREITSLSLSKQAWRACTIHNDQSVACADGKHRKPYIPSRGTARKSAASMTASCILIDGQARCWGKGNAGLVLKAPQLNQPYDLAMEGDTRTSFACALDQDGIKCWGDKKSSRLNPPAISDPIDLALSLKFGCALSKQELKCWGDTASLSEKPQTKFDNAQALALETRSLCVIDDGYPRCWGSNSKRKPPSSIASATEITNSLSTTCVIEQSGVTCWGGDYTRYGVKPRN